MSAVHHIGSQVLITAVLRGEMDIVSWLLYSGVHINWVHDFYGTALAAAAYGGHQNIISLLLDIGANINEVGGDYGTALAAAAFAGKTGTVSLLLDRGANINKVGSLLGTPLAAAAYKGRTNIVTLLLDRGANINEVGTKYGTALAVAAHYGHSNIMSLLLDRGANIDEVDAKSGTALAVAAFKGSTDIVLLLLDRGANINEVGGDYGTALAAAAYGGSKYVVSLLLDRGANINNVGAKYGTALAAAAYRGEKDIMSLLLDRGANINAVGGEYGTALAAAAFKAGLEGWMGIVSLLLARGANVNGVGGKYGTPLAAAAIGGSTDIVSLLLDQGADINLVAGSLGTVLGQAIHIGSTKMVACLLEHGADLMRVGGSYSTASGVYPSALDAAHSEGSRADPALLALLTTAISKQSGSTNQLTHPNVDTLDVIISRPPFPMPYNPALCARTVSSSVRPSDILATQFPAQFPAQFLARENITSDQAGVACRELEEEVLCRSLAVLVGLDKNAIQDKYEWIRNDVRYFVACNFEFGFAYAAARVAWKHFNEPSVDSNIISIQRGQWHKHAQILDKARSKAIEIDKSSSRTGHEVIILPYTIMPRRLWDLRGNRVVDFQMLHAAQPTIETTPSFWAVSHSWTSDMSSVLTPINQHQWPIPLPTGNRITLDSLRSELLTLGAEYVWIDVVCLRQQSSDDHLEQLRQEEWKLDVPTIGNIYRRAAGIVRYFNGLGVCFSSNGWDNPRHWLQRAWTLQEIAAENTTINGGVPRDLGQVFLNSQGEFFGKVMKFRNAIRPVIQLAAEVDSPHGCEVYELAQEMTRRYATNPVDKLSGLFYLLGTTKLPCYDELVTGEDIWGQCFHLLPDERKAEILFNFPYRGSDKQWFPTWAQVLDWPVRDPECDHMRSYGLKNVMSVPEEMFFSNIWTIPNAVFYETGRPGEYEVKTDHGLLSLYFYLPYLLQEPISVQGRSVFTLATTDLGHAHNWLVCRAIGKWVWTNEVNVLHKVGVVRTDSCGELSAAGLLRKMDCLFV